MGGPLTNIQVLDCSHWGVGPWCGMLLGGLGARVLKVDPPGGDPLGEIPPRQKGAGTIYLACNMYKENARLDLKTEAGRAIVYQVIRNTDIFLENMSLGTIERLGMGYEVLSKINPQLIYVSCSPYGREGPLARNVGIDCVVQSISGFASITGSPGGRPELLRYEGHVDVTTGLSACLAILQALIMRERDGKGRRVNVSMLAAALKVQSTRLAEFFATGEQPPLQGSAAAATAPHKGFLCQDRKWILVGVVTQAQWRRFCLAIGKAGLTDAPDFSTNSRRVQNRQRLYHLLDEHFASHPYRWWEIQLAQYRVPHGPNTDFSAILTHHEMRRYLKLVEHSKRGSFYVGKLPINYSRTSLGEPLGRADPLEPTVSPEEILALMTPDQLKR